MRFSESNVPNPSSIARKFGLGKFETLIRATLIASDEMNFSMPDVNSSGHELLSYFIKVRMFLPSVSNIIVNKGAFFNQIPEKGYIFSTRKFLKKGLFSKAMYSDWYPYFIGFGPPGHGTLKTHVKIEIV